MPRCSACGRSPENPEDLVLAKNDADRWITLCADCRAKGVDALSVATPVESEDGQEPEAGLVSAAPPGRTFANVARVLGYLRTIRQKAEIRNRTRSHDRQDVELPIRFKLNRDDTYHNGVIKDISRSGLRLLTARLLERGQHIQFDPDAMLPPALAGLLGGSAEVRRVSVLADGQCEAGIRFVPRMVAKADNRRRHKRYQCTMRGYVLREGSSVHLAAEVTDISQGGMHLRMDEALTDMEIVQVRIRGDSGSFTRGDLVGTVQVRRAYSSGHRWEAGCMFQQTRIEPRPLDHPPAARNA